MPYRSTVAGCQRFMTTVRLWRPVGEKELALIAELGWPPLPTPHLATKTLSGRSSDDPDPKAKGDHSKSASDQD
jgi:hypothetical protein